MLCQLETEYAVEPTFQAAIPKKTIDIKTMVMMSFFVIFKSKSIWIHLLVEFDLEQWVLS